MIRPASASDEPCIRACATLAFARYVPVIGRKPAPMVADFASQIAAGHIYVATNEEGHVLGYISFYETTGQMHLESVAVLPSVVGQGVGKELMPYCEQAARLRGLGSVCLYTNERMTENLAMYQKLGYVEVTRRVEDGFHRVYFEKSVA